MVCIYARMYVCMYVCMYACVYLMYKSPTTLTTLRGHRHVIHISHLCAHTKYTCGIKPCGYTYVKYNTTCTHTYVYIVFVMKRSSLLPVVP